jgi:prevent-host-death family protein
MLHVDLDNILTHDELATKAEEVLRKADDEKKIVVITRNGRPAVAVLQLEMLEELSGKTVSSVQPPVVVPPLEPPMSTPPAPPAEPVVTPPSEPLSAPPVAEMPHFDASAAPAPEPMIEQPEQQPKDESGLPDMP